MEERIHQRKLTFLFHIMSLLLSSLANEIHEIQISFNSQLHILWCPSYAPLRQSRDLENDEDLVHYFQDVFKIREENEQVGLSCAKLR